MAGAPYLSVRGRGSGRARQCWGYQFIDAPCNSRNCRLMQAWPGGLLSEQSTPDLRAEVSGVFPKNYAHLKFPQPGNKDKNPAAAPGSSDGNPSVER
jgi:hypothetical protein